MNCVFGLSQKLSGNKIKIEVAETFSTTSLSLFKCWYRGIAYTSTIYVAKVFFSAGQELRCCFERTTAHAAETVAFEKQIVGYAY